MTLIVDVGTNAEIVLGNRHRLLAASSPTGPAFEGAQISCGQRAAPGAIERVRIDPRDAGAALPGHRQRQMVRTSRASPRQTDARPASPASAAPASSRRWRRCISPASSPRTASSTARWRRSRRASRPDGRTFSYRAERGRAAAAHHPERRARHPARQGGALCRRAAADGPAWASTSVDRITLAGAFGSHIDVKYAMVLGMIPDCDLPKVTSAGNAAGTGARIALLNRAIARRDRRASSSGSRRSRRRWSRCSSSISSRRWRSRTRPRPIPICARL